MAFDWRKRPHIGIGGILVLFCGLMLPAEASAAPMLSPSVTPEVVGPVLQTRLDGAGAERLHDLDLAALQRFYRARDFRPAWIGNSAADSAVAALAASGADGLDPARYHAPGLAARQRLATAADAADYDLTLTDGLLRYAHDLRRGQIDPNAVDKMVGLTRPPFDPVTSLQSALANNDLRGWLASLPPDHRQYAGLKAALARYRQAVADGGWPKLPVVRKIELEPGNPELAQLQRRLAVEDPLISATVPADIDVLEAAVKRFQARNGLEVDGVVGRKTIDALNISAYERAAQIEANMERWRWLPHRFPARYIAVNAADTTLKVVDNGNTVLTSRIIAGKPDKQTAMFNANVIAVTINPPWNVPTSIARNEIMPKLRRDPGYLAKHHMVMINGQIRQLPGADNALGYVKMEMPNPFTEYLHDTASRRLFAREERHLSHGCMRVQNIQPLASYALTGSTDAGLDRIKAVIDTGVTQKIALDRPLPVFVLYWTTIAEADGTVEFRPDVYHRDQTLIAALGGRPGTQAASLAGSGCRGWTG